MQTQRYECTTGGSSKFWTVTVKGNAVTTTWGKIGSDGQSKTQSYKSADEAKADAQKQINKKLTSNYVPAKGTPAATAPAKAPKRPTAAKVETPSKAEKPAKAAKAAKPAKADAGEPVLLHAKIKNVTHVAIAPGGEHLAVSAMPVQIIDLTGKVLDTLGDDEPCDVVYAPDGALFAYDSPKLSALAGSKLAKPIEFPDDVKLWAVTKDRVVVVAWESFNVWNRETGKALVTKTRDEENVCGGKPTRDGKTLLQGTESGVDVWTLANGTKRALSVDLAQGHTIQDVVESRDGKLVVAFSINPYTESALVAWDAKSGKHLWTKTAQPWFESLMGGEMLFALPDGRYVVAGATGIAVWSADGALTANLRLGKEDAALHWSISDDGTKLACVWKENFVRVFDVEAIAAGGIRAKTKPLG